MKNLRTAVIGCGARGQGHIRALKSFEDVDVVAICDPVDVAREVACRDHQIENGYAAVEDLLSKEELDAIVVATPPHLNAPVAKLCLEEGIDTLLEKPPGLNVPECVELRDISVRTGAKGMVGWNRRFNPLILEAKALIAERGPVTQLVGEFHKSVQRILDSEVFGEGLMDNLLLETPIHAIDTMTFLAQSKVVEVHSFVRRATSIYKDVHAALVVFENNCVASIIANYTTDARLERYEVHGCGISAYLEGVRQGVVYCDGNQKELDGSNFQRSTDDQDRFFLDCVISGRPIEYPAANLDAAVESMGLCAKILDGLRE